MTEFQRAAHIQWRMLTGEKVCQDDLTFCLRLAIGDHAGSLLHELNHADFDKLSSAIIQQAMDSELAKRWQAAFTGPHGIPELDARSFLLDFHNCVQESIGLFFSSKITAGTTIKQVGTPGDVNTRRANGKLGWRLHLTTRGTGSYNCIGQQLTSQVGDLVLLSPDALMDYRRDESCDLWQHQWIYFPQQENWIKLLNWPQVAPHIFHLSADGEDFRQIESLFSQVIALHNEDGYLSQALTSNLLEQILLRCKRMAPDGGLQVSDTRISQAKDYILEHFDKPFTIEDVASQVGLSAARLSSLFKQGTGTTIMKYRYEHRMSKAAQLLLHSKLPINQIAGQVGYNDPLYFSRSFTLYLGCSPTEYRDSHQQTSTKA